MSSFLEGLPLVAATAPQWVEVACAHLDEVLQDHAWCEFKAASAGLGMISRFPDQSFLVRPMIALAQEEMLHFRQVTDLLQERGVELGPPIADRYVLGLRRVCCTRVNGLGEIGDHLVLNAFVEARSCERFRILGARLNESGLQLEELANFYQQLAEAEARHWESFRDLAQQACDPEKVNRRIEEVAGMEAILLEQLPVEARMH